MVEQGDPFDAVATHADRIDRASPVEVFSPSRAGTVEHVRAYALDDPAHWHFVTVGLAPLGFELSFRISRPGPSASADDGGEAVPSWAFNLLANLAAYVFRTGHEFGAGHHVDLGGPIKLDSDTRLTAAVFTVDPALDTSGDVEFLQLVGLTADELELCRAWRTSGVIDLLRRENPLLVTRLDRKSLLDDSLLREAAEAGVIAEGSSLDELRVASLRWRRRGGRIGLASRLVITLGAGAATGLGPALRRRLNRSGATFEVIGDDGSVVFEVADAPAWRETERQVVIEMPISGIDELAGLFTGKSGSGGVAALPGLRFVVVP